MKIPLTEASARLRLHPCELVLWLAKMLPRFEDLYPEVDEGFLETLTQMHPELFGKPVFDVTKTPEPPVVCLHLSTDAARLVKVLRNKGHWGTHTVRPSTLKNHYCKDLQNFDSAIKELIRAGILSAERHVRGPFSLNTKARALIDALIRDSDK